MNNDRIYGLEALRIFSFIMVVVIHTAPEYIPGSENSFLALAFQSIARGGFICFFILSGYFALNSTPTNYFKYAYSKIVTIIIPFLIYAYIHFFMIHNNFGMSIQSWSNFISLSTAKDFITAVASGPAFNGPMFASVHFWFVYWIIGALLVSPFISVVIKSIPSNKRIHAIIFLIVLNSVHLYITRYMPSANIIFTPYIIDGWFMYFLIGGLLSGATINPSNYKSVSMILIGYISTIIITIFNFNYFNNNQPPYSDDINMVLISLGAFFLFRNTEFRSKIIIKSVSKHTYSMYLCHVFVLYYISGYTKNITNSILFNTIATLISVIVISYLLSFLIDRVLVFRLQKALKR